MEWDTKVELCNALNDGNYEEAVNIMKSNKDDIDPQAMDMFITGFNLSKYRLLSPIKDIICNFDIQTLDSVVSRLRLSMVVDKIK